MRDLATRQAVAIYNEAEVIADRFKYGAAILVAAAEAGRRYLDGLLADTELLASLSPEHRSVVETLRAACRTTGDVTANVREHSLETST